MKKPSSRICEEIARLQDQLRRARPSGSGGSRSKPASARSRSRRQHSRQRSRISPDAFAEAGVLRPERGKTPTRSQVAVRARRSHLARLRAAVVRLERMRRTSSTDARKKDTREKIGLGGLIVKAGLRYEKRALLLGLLVDGSRRIEGDEAERSRLAAIGAEAFGDGGE